MNSAINTKYSTYFNCTSILLLVTLFIVRHCSLSSLKWVFNVQKLEQHVYEPSGSGSRVGKVSGSEVSGRVSGMPEMPCTKPGFGRPKLPETAQNYKS